MIDGRRRIPNVLLAGDFIGVRQEMGDAAAYGVETLTEAVSCVCQRDTLWELHRRLPSLGFKVTSLGAKGYHHRDCVEHLREHGIAPRIAQIKGCRMPGLLDARTNAPSELSGQPAQAESASNRSSAG